jgi:hypothetical protein
MSARDSLGAFLAYRQPSFRGSPGAGDGAGRVGSTSRA